MMGSEKQRNLNAMGRAYLGEQSGQWLGGRPRVRGLAKNLPHPPRPSHRRLLVAFRRSTSRAFLHLGPQYSPWPRYCTATFLHPGPLHFIVRSPFSGGW